MKVKSVEKVDEVFSTVEDMVSFLLNAPKGYLCHPFGQQCTAAVDNVNKCVYLDEPNFISSIADEIVAESGTEVECEEASLKSMAEEIYVTMGYDEYGRASLLGVFSKEEAAKECGQEHTDCGNINYYEIETPKLDEFGFK